MTTEDLACAPAKTANKIVEMGGGFQRMESRGQVDIDESTRVIKLSGKGTVNLFPDKAFEDAKAFTVEAVFTPNRLKKTQCLLDSPNPPVRIELKPDGTLTGSLHTAQGWQTIDSGERKVVAKETVSIRFVRKENGDAVLEINDRHAASANISGTLVPLGRQGITIGGESNGKQNLFSGTVGGVGIRRGAVDAATIDGYKAKELRLAGSLREHLKFGGRLEVFVDPGTVDQRFNQIKAILRAAGVSDLSTLSTLTINRPTQIMPNQIMIAPPKSRISSVNWGEVAKVIANVSADKAVQLTASALPNRNSKLTLQKLTAANSVELKSTTARSAQNLADFSQKATAELIQRVMTPSATTDKLADSISARKLSSNIADVLNKPLIGEMLKPATGIEIRDAKLLDKFDDDNPDDWPSFANPPMFLRSITTIPVDSSVIIAGRLDLTNQRLMISHNVKTLYIIAEEIVGDTNASITWARPGGSTPPRLADPDKNGRSYSGVHTPSNSRNGLRGGDGLDGEPGFAAANGIDAPDLEVWVKHLTAMPDIDLNGENGIKGGRGQVGGRGGNGAKGQPGEWWWFFGVQCWKGPGHGGNGGDGGRGGRGGPGGDGGRGGDIAIGVLQGTLANTVQARAFRIKNQGGQVGRGGDGGAGGMGGAGGAHGNDIKDGQVVCGTGVNGTRGAQGQPGPVGGDGRLGADGSLRFFEFSEESWNEQLTRPWLYELTPTQAFPGDNVTVTGTRFADTDRVMVGGVSRPITINADESITFNLPATTGGGEKDLYVRRFDGVESNHLRLWVKPRLDMLPSAIAPGSEVTISGRAFVSGAKVLYNGSLTDATFVSSTTLRFQVPGTGGVAVAETGVRIAVRNPDGMESNERIATVPRTLDCGFRIGVHDLPFDNFAVGSPSWGTFEQTFGAFEVWHELMDPIFGHPILTAAFYGFYNYFLRGKDNGGLATGFCTSMSALVLDEYYTGSTDTHTRYSLNAPTRERLTAIHGRLLSRESLLDFHDQGRLGTANVATVFRRIEASLRDGADRNSALMLFFVPAGEIWDEGYFDMLSDSHCIVPIRMVYPVGHDGSSIAGVTLFCWDCNHPVEEGAAVAHNCRLEFRNVGGEIRFTYFDGTSTARFTSEDGITLASMSNGKYLLSDHDLPFSGPLGVTRFVLDFLLSPADLLAVDGSGRQTGLVAGNILSEIPDSHPAYLAKNLYMLPADQALTRRITGNGVGNYAYHSVSPNGTSFSLENVATTPGETDVLAVNADASQIRFTPGASKHFRFNLAREVGGQMRAIAVDGVAASATAAMDMTISPDLSVVRVGNQEALTNVNVRVSVYQKDSGANTTLDRNSVSLPTNHDLMVTVTDWDDLALTVRALPFN
ncbi:MAG: IPT/TIG domain-containing protein [Gammaproteobacteria bacterium]|nr:IPT/TIG domain-containing protein [Gammaproteobacteria bacterium]